MKAIMYHYVQPYHSELPFFKNLHFDDFKKQLDYFESKFGFVDKEEFFDILKGKNQKIPDGVILTFDDGLKSHFSYVLPELKKRNLWGIFYVPVSPYLTGKMLDVHRIHLLLGKINAKEVYAFLNTLIKPEMLDESKMDEFSKLTYLTQKNDNYTLAVKRILNYFILYDYRDYILSKLMNFFIPDEKLWEGKYYMSIEELRELKKQGMIIGSHTVSHPVLSKLSYDEQVYEIMESFAFLEDKLNGLDVKTFCYPYGGYHTFTKETIKILNDNKVLFSFNVEHRDIEPDDLINGKQFLPRYDCNAFPYGQVRT